MIDLAHVYHSALGAAQVYALVDPARAPEPPGALLAALAIGLLGLALAHYRPRT